MNKTERAIKYFADEIERLEIDGVILSDFMQAKLEYSKIAYQALKEKSERDQGCSGCWHEKKLMFMKPCNECKRTYCDFYKQEGDE